MVSVIHTPNYPLHSSPQLTLLSHNTLARRVKQVALYSLNLLVSTITTTFHYTIKTPLVFCALTVRYITNKIASIWLKIFFYLTCPHTHTQLSLVAAGLGYPSYQGGFCNGIALMGMQAALIGDIKSFTIRIQKLEILIKRHYGNIPSVVEELKKDPVFFNECLAFFDGISLWQRPQQPNDLLSESNKITQNSQLHLKQVIPLTASKNYKMKEACN